jgi:hypothetical protein
LSRPRFFSLRTSRQRKCRGDGAYRQDRSRYSASQAQVFSIRRRRNVIFMAPVSLPVNRSARIGLETAYLSRSTITCSRPAGEIRSKLV